MFVTYEVAAQMRRGLFRENSTLYFSNGKDLWVFCEDCQGWVKLTGWFRGVHLCA